MNQCKEWNGPRQKGYGYYQADGERVRLHRWVLAQIHGWEALEGKVVMHLCDNPPCFLYEHLRIGTHADNIADKIAKGRHPRGEQINTAKLNRATVAEIRKRYAKGGVTLVELGAEYGVNHTAISKLVRRETWK